MVKFGPPPSTFTNIAGTATVDDAGSGQGAAFGDYDADGDLDLFLANNGSADRLYRNDGSNVFADQAGTTADTGGGRSPTFADFDNDGDLDLHVVRGSGEANFLYENTDGAGAWSEVAASKGVASTADSYTSGWADYDADGDLDLFITVYGAANLLYQNDGSGSFTDVASTAGVNDASNAESAAWADYNGDGLMDLYVANNASNNLLYRNDGDGTFTDDASAAGVQAAASATIGAAWGDYDDDGYVDLFVGNNSATSDQLFSNDGDGTFTDATSSAGVTNTTAVVGAAWADYDNDGDLELFANGAGVANLLWLNNGDGTFSDVASGAGVDATDTGRGAVWGDIDGNGTQDLYVVNTGTANQLYSNNGHATNRYLRVELEGVDSNEYGYGAEVTAVEDGVFRQTRSIDTGSGWNSQGAEIIHFGIGSVVTLDSLIVKWTTGRIQVVTAVAGNALETVTDPGGLPQFNEVAAGANVANVSNDLMSSWADYDGDGDIDLYVGSDDANILFRNENNGQFTDINLALVELTDDARAIVWGDYDNDGDLDLFVSNNGSSDKLFRNDGGGSFNDQSATAGTNDTGAGGGAAWGDYNGDGYLDLYRGRDGAANQLYGNDGDGTFTVVGGNEADGTTSTYGVSFADYDDDGDLDIHVANHGVASNLYRNDAGTYNDAGITALELVGASPGATWGDYDNDGDLDLYFASDTNDDLVRNDGSGTFVSRGAFLGLVDAATDNSAQWADVDNDGDLDLFVSAHNASNDKLYLNKGDGTFEGQVGRGVGLVDDRGVASYGASFADYDNDGDIDLFVARYGDANKLYRNDTSNSNKYLTVKLQGSNFFDGIGAVVRGWVGGAQKRRDVDGGSGYSAQGSQWVEFGFGSTTTLDSLVIDWPSGVHYSQATVATNQTLTINENLPVFTDVSSTAGVNTGGNIESVSWVDYDGDGDQDIYSVGRSSANKLYQNNGSGVFTDIANAPENSSADDLGAVWGDYDNDGDLDVFIAVNAASDKLLRNDGSGVFVDVAGTAGTNNNDGGTITGAWADYDNDGDLDLYISVSGGTGANVFYENDGDGTFTVNTAGAGLTDTGGGRTPSWADYDGDGDMDLALANFGANVTKVWKNNGNSTMTALGAPFTTTPVGHGVSWVDYDGDNDLDLYITASSAANTLYRNDGSDTFVEVAASAGVTGGVLLTYGGAWADADNDGDIDLAVANHGAADQFFLNQGNGQFTEVSSPVHFNNTGNGRGLAWGDKDGDGDLDLYLATDGGSTNILYQNEGNTNKWLHVNLTGTMGSSDGIGTMVRAYASIHQAQVGGGSSYSSQNSLPVEFGFGSTTTIDSLVLDWPTGTHQVIVSPSLDQELAVTETSTFMEVAAAVGLGSSKTYAVSWADYDNDGDLDLYLGTDNTGFNRLYSNDGDGTFTDVSVASGTANSAFGVACTWADYDNDGDLDLYLGNDSAANTLYRNNGDNTFTDVSASPINDAGDSFGANWVDYDLDGDVDLYIANQTGTNKMFRNDGGGTFIDATPAVINI